MKKLNRHVFLILILVLSILPLSSTPIALGAEEGHALSPMEYLFIKGTASPYNTMYDSVHSAPGTSVSISETALSIAGYYSNQRKLVRVSNGTLYAVHVRKLGPYYQIYVEKSEDEGATWIDETRISIYPTMNSWPHYEPSIAVDSNDTLHVVWKGRITEFPASTQIWYANSSAWVNATRISDVAGMDHEDNWQTHPTIVVDSEDNLHILWQGKADGYASGQIWYKNYIESWSNPIRINTDTRSQSGSSIAVDSEDNLHVVWGGRTAEYPDNTQIWYRNYNVSWGTITRISTYGGMESYDQYFPTIALDSLDELHVAWYGKATGFTTNYQIWYNKKSTSWAGPIRISTNTDMYDYDQEFPSIAVDSKDDIHVLWDGKTTSHAVYDKIWYAKYNVSWITPECIQEVGQNIHPCLRWSRWPDPASIPTYAFKILYGPGGGFGSDESLDEFDWGSSWGDEAFWYTSYPWVFEGKRRYSFLMDYYNETLSDIVQINIRFTDDMGETHIISYDKDANTLDVTSPFDGISGWLHSFSQEDTNVTAIFQIMFNKPIPDSYGVQLQMRLITDEDADTGWLTPDSGGIFNIYNLGGLSTIYSEGTAGRISGGDIFEIYAADTRTRNIVPVEGFDVRYVPLRQEGWQEWVDEDQQTPSRAEQDLLDELTDSIIFMDARSQNHTMFPTNGYSSRLSASGKTYHSYPFGLRIYDNPRSLSRIMFLEKEFYRKIVASDNELVIVQVYAMVPTTKNTTGRIAISENGYYPYHAEGGNTNPDRAANLIFAGNSSIRAADGASWTTIGSYTGETWYNITFVLDMTPKTYDVYIDGNLNASGLGFQDAASVASLGYVSFLQNLWAPVGNYTDMYVDDVWAHTNFTADYGGISEATMLFDKNQHWSMDFDFFVENGQVYAQGSSSTPFVAVDDYSDHGYIELGWDLMINKTMVHDFIIARINITDGQISGKNDWIQFNVTWYANGTYMKNDILYGLFEGYSLFPGSSKDTCGFHWDVWFNRANASTVVGARVNTEYYGMSDKAKWWAVWSSKWTPMRSEVSESTLFVNLRDNPGAIHPANDVSFVRSWVKVLRNDQAQFAYKVLNIAGLDFLVAIDTMSGIDTPPIRETLVPDVMSGFFGSALGAIFTSALKRLGNTLAGFGMGFFSLSIDFIDHVFAALGYPALVTTIFSWMDSLFANVPTLLGYGLTLIDTIFGAITVSASNTLTQLTSVVTIWIGMYSTVMDMLNGVLTPGINLWNDLGINSFIQIGAILYPLWLLMMASDKGMQAVIDHLTGVLNIGSFFLNFILNVAGFFVSLLTGLIGAIRG